MIIGDRIRLRAIEKQDLPYYVKWLNDPEVRQGLSMIMPISLVDEEEWFASLQQKSPFERPLAIEIQPEPTIDKWVFVGNCGLFSIDWTNRVAEAGIHIGEKSCWSQGFGTETMQLILKHGFESLNLNRIWLRVFETNQRAIRAYEKAGFIQEGKFRQAQYLEGNYVDVIIMSVLRSEWKDNQ